MTCLLCLSENEMDYIDIHSDKGRQLAIAKIINTHFSLNLSENCEDMDMEKVCSRCWKTVSEFHTLHEFVATAQRSLVETKLILTEDDPLTMAHTKLNATEIERNFFYPEVKIEEHELEQLPKIEVLENTSNVHIVEKEPKMTRLRKRIKTEEEVEAPVSNDEHQSEAETAKVIKISPTPKKRRGRPRKVQNPVETVNNHKEEEFLDANVERKECDEVLGSDDEHDLRANIDDEFTHSEDSSDESSFSNDSEDDSDYEEDKRSQGEFAVIPKRTAVRPKKYKKRTKPMEPKVRMSREMLEQRKKQQKDYDGIIAKFFNNVLSCPVCNLLVHNFTEMQRHHRFTHQIDPGYMMCCGRKFTQRKVLAEHVLVHWDPEHFKCDICSKSFQNSRHLESHRQVHVDPTTKLTFHCDQCPKVFLSKTAIEYHKLNKHVPKSEFKFSCEECHKRFLTERKLKNHISAMHDPESTIICDKCGKQMRTKIILKKHQELMHSDKPRPEPELKQCQICGAWLKGMTGLKQHMKSIHVESAGEHRCHVCAKVSPNARALRRHIYHNHECERKFKCSFCDKAFKRPQELREHTSTHTGEVLYTCPNCPMTFFCSANMYKHRQRLHRAQYMADKNQPKPPNILQQAVGATAAMKVKLMHNLSSTTPSLQDSESDMKQLGAPAILQ